MTFVARLVHAPFVPDRELARFLEEIADAGAVASCIGLARARSRAGTPVSGLFLDHHPRLTLSSIEEIVDGAARRFGLTGALVVHRCGAIKPGEAIVLAAAAAAHRRAAFEAADYVMDRLKSEAVFWKREDGLAGSEWIEPTDEDRHDLARWSLSCPE
jgi:molybdopterin synthase catalytic subunit